MWKKKPRKDEEDTPDNDFFGERLDNEFFGDFGRIQKMMDEMMKGMFSGKTFKIDFPKDSQPGKPMVYGFSMKMGPDGVPKFQEFGNVEPGEKPAIKDEREPLIDVMDKPTQVTVIAELPGVEKAEIDAKINANKDALIIKVPGKFYKSVKLPTKVKADVIDAHYKNGVLEINLDKIKHSETKAKGAIEIK